MKLRSFNPSNTPNGRSGKPLVTVALNAGTFTFNRLAIDALGLNEKSQVVIHQDEESPSDWYVEVIGEGGFPLRIADDMSSARFNNKQLGRSIADAHEIDEMTFRLQIARECTKVSNAEMWGLLKVPA